MWVNSFKRRVHAPVILIFIMISIGVAVALFGTVSLASRSIQHHSFDLSGAASMIPSFEITPQKLFIAICIILTGISTYILLFYWIPGDISSHLSSCLRELGWDYVSGDLQRGFGRFRAVSWELTIAIRVYGFTRRQWGPVTLILSSTNPDIFSQDREQFLTNGYAVIYPAASGKIICETTIPNLPWQILRISSLARVTHHTTTFS
ncbi:MAG: hypothetical protein RBG13Loki_3451 [Promethearchaeota archaeon CR_4]|nr:MAG: hypothetical protein RBG13Loki_3451 [Candidatus Lokiarchaeota archaeon CR_4]